MESWCAFVLGVIGASCCARSFKQFANMTEETDMAVEGGSLVGGSPLGL